MITKIKNIITFDDRNRWLGYIFKMTNPQKNITIKISNERDCHEIFGIYTNANLNDFIDAEYISVDIAMKKKPQLDEWSFIDGYRRVVEMNIYTNKGVINIQLYNEHNGYYPHDFYVETEYGKKIDKL